MDIVSHIEDGYFLSNVLGTFVDTKILNQKGGEWAIAVNIRCFFNWDPISTELLENLRAPMLGRLLNWMIKFGIVMVTLICLPFIPWILIIVYSWSIFKNYVLDNIVGKLEDETYYKVIAVIVTVLIWMFFFIN